MNLFDPPDHPLAGVGVGAPLHLRVPCEGAGARLDGRERPVAVDQRARSAQTAHNRSRLLRARKPLGDLGRANLVDDDQAPVDQVAAVVGERCGLIGDEADEIDVAERPGITARVAAHQHERLDGGAIEA